MIYLILILSTILRYWKLGEWTYFGLDQEYTIYLIQRIVGGVNYPLIGVNVSDTGLYLGPLFLYFGSFWHWWGKGDPVFASSVAAGMGVFVTWLIYYVATKVFHHKIGLLAALFWAVSFPLVVWDRKFWNPSWIPMLSLLILLSLYQIENGQKKFLYLLVLGFGLGFSSHLQIVMFLPLIIYVVLRYWRSLRPKLLKALGILLILVSPLIIFDLSHQFAMSKSLYHPKSGMPANTATNYLNLVVGITRFIGVWGKPELTLENSPVAANLIHKVKVSPISWIVLLGGLIYSWQKRSQNKMNRYFFLLISTTLLLPVFYQKPISDYYLLYIAPWLLIWLAYYIDYLWKKQSVVAQIFIVLFLISQMITFFRSTMNFSLAEKQKAVRFASVFVEDGKYILNADDDKISFGGYRYLFTRYGKTPAKSYIDNNLGWLYENDQEFRGNEVYLFQVEDTSRLDLRDDLFVTAQFGKIGVAIYKNED